MAPPVLLDERTAAPIQNQSALMTRRISLWNKSSHSSYDHSFTMLEDALKYGNRLIVMKDGHIIQRPIRKGKLTTIKVTPLEKE